MFVKLLCWFVLALIGSVLVGIVGQLTGAKIESRSFEGGIVFRMAYMFFGYVSLTALSWALNGL